MNEFTLKDREPDWLTLNIGEHSYKIPLATCIPYEEAKKVDTIDGTVEFLRQYIDADVADKLSLFDFRDILNEWKAASEKSAKAPLGESSASRAS